MYNISDRVSYFNDRGLDEKYNTYIMYFPDKNIPDYERKYMDIIIRPCELNYDDFIRGEPCTIEAAVMGMKSSLSMEEALMEASLYGITVDIIEVFVRDRKSYDSNILRVIDLHKDGFINDIEIANGPRYYIVRNPKKRDIMKFLVIDRNLFKPNIETNPLKGEFQTHGIIGSFRTYDNAEIFLKCKEKQV